MYHQILLILSSPSDKKVWAFFCSKKNYKFHFPFNQWYFVQKWFDIGMVKSSMYLAFISSWRRAIMSIQSNKFDAKMMYIWIIMVKWFMKSLSNVLQCNLILHFYPPFEKSVTHCLIKITSTIYLNTLLAKFGWNWSCVSVRIKWFLKSTYLFALLLLNQMTWSFNWIFSNLRMLFVPSWAKIDPLVLEEYR